MYRLLKSYFVITMLLLGTLLTCQPVQALTLKDQRIKVYLIWKDNRLVAYKLKFRNQHRDTDSGRISGQISGLNRSNKNFKLGPYQIVWDENTKFQQITADALADGRNVKVIGVNTTPGQLIASKIEPGDADIGPDTLKVLGAVSAIHHQNDGNVQATILGKPIVVSSNLFSSAYLLTQKQDDRRPDDQLTFQLFDKPLTIGGEIGVTPRYRKNFNLDPNKNRDRVRLDTEAQLELFYPWNRNLAFFVEGQVGYQQDLYRGSNGTLRNETELKRGESWVFWGEIWQSNFSLQVGRQNFQESREWWWDNDLDAVRLYYHRPFFRTELGISEQLFPVSTADFGIPAEEQDVFRVLSHTSWEWAGKQTLGLFFLYQHDHSKKDSIKTLIRDEFLDPVDGDFTWLGLRTQNRFSASDYGEFSFWTDVAWVIGEERITNFKNSGNQGVSIVGSTTSSDIEGWAIDIGLTWKLPRYWMPALIIGYAVGSPEFRQTGLQDNNDRFRAISRFRYYGELLRPELSNLHILTLGATFPVLDNSSISAIYHYYRQVDAQPFLRQGRIRPDPNGISPSIGQEWDLVLALEEWKHWELEFVTGVFRAGPAYGAKSGNIAANVVFKVNYNF